MKVSSLTDLNIWDAVKSKMDYSDDLRKVLRIIARMIRGWRFMKDNIRLNKKDTKTLVMLTVSPFPHELNFAEKLVLLSGMPETLKTHKDKRLDSLIPKLDGKILVTTGRLGKKSLSTLIGKPHLPVLMSNTRAAHCGEGD